MDRVILKNLNFGVFWIAKEAKCLHVEKEDSNQTLRWLQTDLRFHWAPFSEGIQHFQPSHLHCNTDSE